MRYLIASFIVLLSCNSAGDESQTSDSTTTTTTTTVTTPPTSADTVSHVNPDSSLTVPGDTTTRNTAVYSNKRFKEVRVRKLIADRYLITGKAQIFEANFSWYIEDGHEEIKSGHEMTDAGAPEWGDFSFTVRVRKKRPNSTLHLVLYESSAMDGSRQHELPVRLN